MPPDRQYRIGDVSAGARIVQGENICIGFSRAQVEQLIQAERDGLVRQYTSQLVELSGRFGATQEAVRAMLSIAGQSDVAAERWSDTLIAIAMQYRAMRQALTGPANDDARITRLR